jgi:HSP20 family molecular chaperone IbpA
VSSVLDRWDRFRDPMSIQDELDKGVLTIEVPKREAAKPRKITVEAS